MSLNNLDETKNLQTIQIMYTFVVFKATKLSLIFAIAVLNFFFWRLLRFYLYKITLDRLHSQQLSFGTLVQ